MSLHSRLAQKLKKLRGSRRPFLGSGALKAASSLRKVGVCTVCRQAVQRQIGPARATRHHSSSVSRCPPPRESNHGLPRLVEQCKASSHGRDAVWNSTLGGKSTLLSVNSPSGRRCRHWPRRWLYIPDKRQVPRLFRVGRRRKGRQ